MVNLANDTEDDAKMHLNFGGTIRFVYVLNVDPGFYDVRACDSRPIAIRHPKQNF